MTDCEVKEYFSILQEACHVEESSLDVAYRQLRELLERFVPYTDARRKLAE